MIRAALTQWDHSPVHVRLALTLVMMEEHAMVSLCFMSSFSPSYIFIYITAYYYVNVFCCFICSYCVYIKLGTYKTADVDECVESAMSGSSACPEGRICRNTIGSFSCDCPEGTMLNSEGECEGKLIMLHIYSS